MSVNVQAIVPLTIVLAALYSFMCGTAINNRLTAFKTMLDLGLNQVGTPGGDKTL